jgi:hypothetical protein
MKETLIILFIGLFCFGCNNFTDHNIQNEECLNSIECTDNGCAGTYSGSEFINGSDVAHQFSNKMSGMVGDKLKRLFGKKLYSVVDFSKIEMSTDGMGSGNVVYKLTIPFARVNQKCDAFTSFDHVGGWNHPPALSSRIKQLKSVLMKGDELEISELKTTPEGLQEYWIQWKNNVTQAECED